MRMLFPVVVVPARPGMFVLLMAPAGIAALGASPPIARGMLVVPTPESCRSEYPRRASPPNLNECFARFQLRESAHDHWLVTSLYVDVVFRKEF